MSEYKILVLDSQGNLPNLAEQLVAQGLTATLTFEGDEANSFPTLLTRDELMDLTRNMYDLIVLGDNDGYGKLRAVCIPEELRDRCLILFFTEPGATVYRNIGYRNFSTRRCAAERIAGILAPTPLLPTESS